MTKGGNIIMGRWMPIEEVLNNPSKYGFLEPSNDGSKCGAFCERYINYVPDKKEVFLGDKVTGHTMQGLYQKAATEESLSYYPFLLKGMPCLVAESPTDFKIWLAGKNGVENGPKSLRYFSSNLYSNKELKADADCFTPEKYRCLPEFLRRVTSIPYWLAENCYKKNSKGKFISGLIVANDNGLDFCFLDYGHSYESSVLSCKSFGVRNIIHLHSSTEVLLDDEYYDGMSQERAMQIRLNQDEQLDEQEEKKTIESKISMLITEKKNDEGNLDTNSSNEKILMSRAKEFEDAAEACKRQALELQIKAGKLQAMAAQIRAQIKEDKK